MRDIDISRNFKMAAIASGIIIIIIIIIIKVHL